MLFKKNEESPETFWREYEEKTGEKVLTRGLGKYISGWDEFDKKRWNGLWGLIINTTSGFRFHHFPQNSIFNALFQYTPDEKTIFLPQEKIISQTFIKEEKLLKRLFFRSAPRLVINYRDNSPEESSDLSTDKSGEKEKKLVFEAEYLK